MQAKRDNELIIYVKNTKILKSGAFTSEFAMGLQILSTNIFCKEAASMFTNNNLDICLKNNKITEMELLDVDGNSCVAISAIEAHRKGYAVIFLCRSVGVKKIERFLEKKSS